MTVQEYLSSTELISMKMICIMIVHVKGPRVLRKLQCSFSLVIRDGIRRILFSNSANTTL